MEHDDTINIRIDRRWLRRLMVVAATVALVIPATAWAGHQFSDVTASNTFHADIDWMKDTGVTKGCNPPANTKYCPSDFVTREQMAAFMHRLETQGVFLPADGKADDADTVDGVHAGDLVGAGVHVTRGAGDAPVVQRWFNNVNGTEPTVTGTEGSYTIDFGSGFDATSRFVQCTIDSNFADTRTAICTASTPTASTVRVRVFNIFSESFVPAEFWIHVYGVAAG